MSKTGEITNCSFKTGEVFPLDLFLILTKFLKLSLSKEHLLYLFSVLYITDPADLVGIFSSPAPEFSQQGDDLILWSLDSDLDPNPGLYFLPNSSATVHKSCWRNCFLLIIPRERNCVTHRLRLCCYLFPQAHVQHACFFTSIYNQKALFSNND